MKWTGLLMGLLMFLAAACTSRISQTTTVLQGGISPVPAAPLEEIAPTPEPEIAADLSPAPEEKEVSTDGPEENIVSAAAKEAVPALPSRPAVPVPVFAPEPYVTPPPPENENEPTPELVGPDDEKIIEELKGPEHVEAEPEIDPSPEVEYDLPLELHIKVLKYIELFQTSRRKNFTRGLVRTKKYEDLVKAIFREEGVPTDLYYLALVESAYNPRAYSRAKAMGIWQFIYTTGRAYGLHRTHWIDERRDPDKSSRAAARHLRDLYEDLGSWPLALAAYNSGINRVKRAIAKAGSRDFWKLRLPAQTRNYVPAFFAAMIISKEPETYGFIIEYEPPIEYDTVEVEGGTRLSLIAAFCSTSLRQIKDINPELRQGVVPPGGRYTVRIPPGSEEVVLEGLARTPVPKITGGSRYRIRSGDTLSTISLRFGTTIEAIQEVNNLSDHFIRAGGTLIIPGSGIAGGSIPSAPQIEIAMPASGRYRVRRGDSLWSVSRKFSLSLERLMSINGLTAGSVLQIGQVLALRPQSGGSVARTKENKTGTFFYRVRRGDNLWKIARRFDTDIKAILHANDMKSGQVIYPGERLVIPGGKL